ncbi:SDR family NAD(P)-dependent oxidoreductase [Rhodococcus qingshengii]|uniref:SDR family oxidoreductase n=1 Tax=Rhodococcus qingshengii TaxID=334542 RepID=UPI0005A998E8|nr:SDR family NAD(P)-dependent oxidoreductase [Rhodococcus qingshengii]MDJ0489908.1 SDR family NAD(P)-dependent oxidoreductase [Rhodococcus qingshengii]
MKLNSHQRTLGDLTGRTALITGASSGIGAATVQTFLAAGARVHAVARRKDAMNEVAPAAVDDGRLILHPLDVADGSAVQALADELAVSDPIDTLVLAAGRNVNPRTFGDLTFDAFDELMKVNLNGVFYALRATLPQLRENTGDVVIISSVAAFWPDHSGAAYQASKAGVTALARGAARDEHGNGVRITSILPGVVNTPILDKRPVPPPAEVRAWFIQPEDVATASLAAVTMPGRTTVSEITLTATRLQSIGNTQQATPVLPDSLVSH